MFLPPESRRGRSARSDWIAIILFSLVGSFSLGVFYRSIFALPYLGFSSLWPELNYRHAHSHLGFYGVLVPLVFVILQLKNPVFKMNQPRQQGFYFFITLISIVGFLFQGYGPISHGTSFVLLLFWCIKIFSAKFEESSPEKTKALKTVQWGMLFSVLSFLFFLINQILKGPFQSEHLVRGFLMSLLFGVILPALLYAQNLRFNPLAFLISNLFLYLEASKVSPDLTKQFPFILGGFLIWIVIEKYLSEPVKSLKERSIEQADLFILGFGLMLWAFFSEVIRSHSYQILGLHYFIFIVAIGRALRSLFLSDNYLRFYFFASGAHLVGLILLTWQIGAWGNFLAFLGGIGQVLSVFLLAFKFVAPRS